MDESYLDMSPEELQELLGEVLSEGDGHLQVLNEKLLKAEDAIKSGVEMSDEELNAMFRADHTIKGSASLTNIPAQSLTSGLNLPSISTDIITGKSLSIPTRISSSPNEGAI